jgi:hypothetical protein
MKHDEAAALARTIFDLRRRRADHLPADILGEACWGMLLIMFIADAAGTRLTAYDLFAEATVHPPTGKRWMAVLMEAGLASSEGPCMGANVVSLTAKGISAIEACMQDASEVMMTKATPPTNV